MPWLASSHLRRRDRNVRTCITPPIVCRRHFFADTLDNVSLRIIFLITLLYIFISYFYKIFSYFTDPYFIYLQLYRFNEFRIFCVTLLIILLFILLDLSWTQIALSIFFFFFFYWYIALREIAGRNFYTISLEIFIVKCFTTQERILSFIK